MKVFVGITITLLAIALMHSLLSTIPNGYDINQSKKYGAYSFAAFCPKKCIEQWNCKLTSTYNKLVNVTYIENQATKAMCFVGYDPIDRAVIISWRGSRNKANQIQDLNFEMQPYKACPGCWIHTGFMTDYILNQDKMIFCIKTLMDAYRVQKIVTTGHSLGGALSTISGIQLAQKYTNIPVFVHNFGSPRIGNENLVNFIVSSVKQIYRVVHSHDIVPHLPPSIQYKHPHYEVFFNDAMTSYQICNASGEDPNCSNKYFPNYSANDHDFYFINLHSIKC